MLTVERTAKLTLHDCKLEMYGSDGSRLPELGAKG